MSEGNSRYANTTQNIYGRIKQPVPTLAEIKQKYLYVPYDPASSAGSQSIRIQDPTNSQRYLYVPYDPASSAGSQSIQLQNVEMNECIYEEINEDLSTRENNTHVEVVKHVKCKEWTFGILTVIIILTFFYAVFILLKL
ncbi:uncharacterized protein ACRADG_002326 isoform 2-T3 [Cochliomyia hominivorax]